MSYKELCPVCGSVLLGFVKEDYVSHLRDHGESLMADIEERMVI